MTRLLPALLAGLCLAAGGRALAEDTDPAARQGGSLYRSRCALCHGRAGDGRGAAATGLTPRPTDFTAPDLWARVLPGDLAASVRQGRPGTPMPAFPDLSEEDLEAVVRYLATFRQSSP